jgi:hypothetical protein
MKLPKGNSKTTENQKKRIYFLMYVFDNQRAHENNRFFQPCLSKFFAAFKFASATHLYGLARLAHAQFGNRTFTRALLFPGAQPSPNQTNSSFPSPTHFRRLHHRPRGPSNCTPLQFSSDIPLKMLACRSFAAPARQCLRRATASQPWAPAQLQVSCGLCRCNRGV